MRSRHSDAAPSKSIYRTTEIKGQRYDTTTLIKPPPQPSTSHTSLAPKSNVSQTPNETKAPHRGATTTDCTPSPIWLTALSLPSPLSPSLSLVLLSFLGLWPQEQRYLQRRVLKVTGKHALHVLVGLIGKGGGGRGGYTGKGNTQRHRQGPPEGEEKSKIQHAARSATSKLAPLLPPPSVSPAPRKLRSSLRKTSPPHQLTRKNTSNYHLSPAHLFPSTCPPCVPSSLAGLPTK